MFRRFLAEEDGAVTVDWVVLTAGVVVLGIFVAQSIVPGLESASCEIESTMSAAGVNSDFTVNGINVGGSAGC